MASNSRLLAALLLLLASSLCALPIQQPSPAPTRFDLASLPVDYNYTSNTKECLNSLLSLSSSLVGIAGASSSDTSLLAEAADPSGFAAEIGGYDLCMRQQGHLAHCLAGSIKLGDPFVSLPPHSGLCVPLACGPKELQDPVFLKHLRREITSLVHAASSSSSSSSSSLSSVAGLSTQSGQQRFIYYVKLVNTIQLTTSTNSSYTCGAHRASMTFDRYLFFFALTVLLFIVAGSTVYQMTLSLTLNGAVAESIQPPRESEWKKWRLAVVYAFSLVNTVPFIFQPRPTSGGHGVDTDHFLVLDGLRAVSILWIVLGHTLTVSTSIGIVNPAAVFPPNGFLKDLSAQLLLSSRFAVDTFFFISGFLVVLSLLKRLYVPVGGITAVITSSAGQEEQQIPRPKSQILLSSGNRDFELSPVPVRQPPSNISSSESMPLATTDASRLYQAVNTADADAEGGGGASTAVAATVFSSKSAVIPDLRSWLPSFYVHRLLRIWPPYIFCLLLWWKIGVLLGSGPFWYRWLSFTHRCDQYFWTNLLFINNLVPYDISESDECFYVSWYLADDMQFYLISPLFVVVYLWNDLAGVALAAGAVVLSCFASYQQSLKHAWSAHSFDGLNVTRYSHFFYTKPQYRLPAYAVGMIAAMLWHIKCRRCSAAWKLPSVIANSILLSACAVITLLIFGGVSAYQQRPCGYFEPISPHCGSNWSPWALASYASFSKPCWSIAIACITLLSGNHQGGAVEKFLSHALFAPLAKLSFSVYLLHVTVLNIWMLGRTQKLRYSHFDFTMDFLAVVFVSFAGAVVVAVVIESPSARLSKALESWITQWWYSSRSAEVKAKQQGNAN